MVELGRDSSSAPKFPMWGFAPNFLKKTSDVRALARGLEAKAQSGAKEEAGKL
jgi:hypothetical protein